MNIEYLKKSVGKYLCKALCEVAIRRPERPIEFLAYYLVALYEKDLELQRTEQAVSKEELKSVEDLTTIPQFSQLFMKKLSSSVSRNLDDISPAAASPSISIGLEEEMIDEDRPASDKEDLLAENLMGISSEEEDLEARHIKSSREKEDLTRVTKTLLGHLTKTVDDDVSQNISGLSLTELYNLPERTPSAIRDNEPITDEEAEEFGTRDPFLARRNTNLFDVNFAPIGDPSNQSNPPM